MLLADTPYTNSGKSCLFRIPEIGGRVLWQITNVCNYKCHYCIFSSGPLRIAGELTFSEVVHIMEELRAENFSYIKFTGGEPFVRKDMCEVLEACHALDIHYDISTNASLISKEEARRIGAACPAMVHVSLDGPTREVHEAVRGPNTFNKTIAGLKHLIAENILVRVGCVLFNGNEDLLGEAASLCADLGASEVIFSRMGAAGRLSATSQLLSQKTDQELLSIVEEARERLGNVIRISCNFEDANPELIAVGKRAISQCPGLSKFLYIDNLGRVAPCSWLSDLDPTRKSAMTLKEYSLLEILASPTMQDFSAFMKNTYQEGKQGCPLGWQ